ncbi:hypothetical protein Rxycam_00147 [Rubrobacter xylanophilus DSM 9941]|uniref:hypothetical protein n=1 Tax=Rubrobacter xylanophilus TaxID=49319 RepID=UPI001C644791|nr:hypothetical protein [Rubrobacter xylanophilus]QYJ14351.1 hypothetical protein Rxycam_00147 [Rubrobacter xylanophilus DSM 9941]
MNLEELFGGSFVNWEAVGESFAKRTVASRLLLFAARRYLEVARGEPDGERERLVSGLPLPDEVRRAFAAPPRPEEPPAEEWGKFIDAAIAAELETVSYGERPPILYELRTGLSRAAQEAGERSALGRWFLGRRDALPGADLPDDPGYLPV